MIQIDPIGHFYSAAKEKSDVPRQAALSKEQGIIRFVPGKNYEQALEDLKGMDKVWVVFWFHKVHSFKIKVSPPRDSQKRGVFATRSPYRPNPIGLSCVSLVEIKGLEMKIQDHDLIDGTPILDIKPYLPYADSFPEAKTGWIQGPPASRSVFWSELAQKQLSFLQEKGVELGEKVEVRLSSFSFPTSSNRVRFLGQNAYLLSYKTWRCLFVPEAQEWRVQAIFSGYDLDSLKGRRNSRWEDLDLHREYTQTFQPFFSETFVGNGWILYSAFIQQKEKEQWEPFLKEGL